MDVELPCQPRLGLRVSHEAGGCRKHSPSCHSVIIAAEFGWREVVFRAGRQGNQAVLRAGRQMELHTEPLSQPLGVALLLEVLVQPGLGRDGDRDSLQGSGPSGSSLLPAHRAAIPFPPMPPSGLLQSPLPWLSFAPS